MNTPTHDFVTVDMRGLKAALVARAQAQRVSVSELVRGAVARDLGLAAECEPPRGEAPARAGVEAASVKLSIRMTNEEAKQLAAEAKAAGLSRGAYLAGLVAGVPVLSAGGGRTEHLAALTMSTAVLATLSRNLYQLSTLLRRGEAELAQPNRSMLDTLARDVRQHLDLASNALVDLQPRRPSSAAPPGRSEPGTRRSHP
jgi:predicted HicB family RNase H-like nuclease